MSLCKKTIETLESYGILINKTYNLENDQQALYTKDMILFVNESDKSIGLSFFAPTIPELASNLTIMMMKNINDSNIYVLESFVFNEKREYIAGVEAFKILKDIQKNQIINNFTKEQNYQYILDNHELWDC